MAKSIGLPLQVCPSINNTPINRCTVFDFDRELGCAKIELYVMGSSNDLIEHILTEESSTLIGSLQGYLVKNNHITSTRFTIFEKAEFQVNKLKSIVFDSACREITSATITVQEIKN